MHPLFYYLFGFMLVGGVGMWAGSRKAAVTVRRQRWLKYFMYILITNIIIASIFYHFFNWVILIIILAGFAELAVVSNKIIARHAGMAYLAFFIYAVVASGSWLFAKQFVSNVQLFFYFQVFIFDAFCQVTGQIAGKRKLAPAVSPAKTIEGFIGGLLFCILAALIGSIWVALPLIQAALYGLITGLTSLCGDLLASYYKRQTGVKDYSNWLPGQGGFLDRFDSLLMTTSVYYFLHLAGLLSL